VAQRQALPLLDLRWVIDLRSAAEVTKAGGAIVLLGAHVVHIPFFEAPRLNRSIRVDQTPRATASRYLEMLQEGLPCIAAVVLQVAQTNQEPFILCCSAGRDRTGVVVACLLDLLDVPEDTIAADYARSDLFDPQTGRAHPETMLELLALLRTRYGSVRDLLAPHSIAEDTFKILHETLLVRT
jgi:protein-tyrosine phosphatase